MKKILFILFTIHYSLFTLLSAAEVTASVNTQEVVKGNPVQFSIRATGGKVAFPQIRQIAGVGVTDSGTSTSTNMSITINGMKKESATTRNYIFVPQHDMVIPSYTVRVGDETLKTQPIAIKVRESDAPQLTGNSNYSFMMKSNKKRVAVGESFVVTLYLNMSQSLGVQQVSDYVAPSSDAFFFKDMGKQKQYRQGNNNVLEKQYSVTAKKEGNFTISPVSAKLGITDRSRQDLFGRYGIRWIDVRSNTLNIEVKAPQIQSDLVGEFTIASKIDTQKVKANKPVNLTVTIRGKGNLEDFEFPKYEIDGVTVYDDEAKVQSHVESGALVSEYQKHFVFISEESFTIPKRTISSYNTKTEEIEVLEVPSYTVEIEKKKGLSNMLSNVGSTSSKIDKKPLERPENSIPEVKKTTVETVSWWMLAAAFALGMLAMYLLRFMPQIWKRKEKPYKESEALKILYAHISEDKAVEEMVNKLYARKHGDKSVQIDKKELKVLVERFR